MTNHRVGDSACGNCGDGSGWHIWPTYESPSGKFIYVWVACADCNDDGLKPKPDLCEGCGQTPAFCECLEAVAESESKPQQLRKEAQE